ncbi:MAG: hypothetical protein ACFCBW_16685 [Candidatus Competibacterales bacterium]
MNVTLTLALALNLGLSAPVYAQAFYYPAEGQTPYQQQRDLEACRGWAVGQAGWPSSPPPAPSSTQSSSRGQALRGAIAGAAIGAIGGALRDEPGRGAAYGAMGGAAGAMGSQGRQGGGWSSAPQPNYSQRAGQQAQFERAVGACMTGRGYSVG